MIKLSHDTKLPEAITMYHLNNTIFPLSHEMGQHIRYEDRCKIKALHKHGFSNRYIAKVVNCSPSTAWYELKRGTAAKTSCIGRPTEYLPARGQSVYAANRKNSGRQTRIDVNNEFIRWVVKQAKNN